jgi:phosphomannomutase/phosphoglucomutase
MLKGKKSAAVAAARGGAEQSGGGRGVGGFFVSALGAILVVMALSGFAAVYLQQIQQQGVNERQLSATASMVAGRLVESVRFYRDALDGYVGSHDLASLFLAEEMDGLKRHEQALKRLLPGMLRVRLLPAEWDEGAGAGDPPFSFASIDLLRLVERRGSTSLAEVHQFGTEHRHVAMALPVKSANGDKVVGVLHAALPFNLVSGAMGSVALPVGWIQVQQLSDGKSVTLVGQGDGPADTDTSGSVPVTGTIWQVGYGVQPMLADTGVLVIPLAVIGAGLLLVVLIQLLQAKRLKQFLKGDLGVLFQQIEGLGDGQAFSQARGVALTELRPLVEVIRRTGTGLARRQRLSRAQQQESGKDPKPGGPRLADPGPSAEQSVQEASSVSLSPSIFRAYDIRGVVGDTLTADVVFMLGQAIGSEAYDKGQQTVIVARDGRLSSEALSDALCRGLVASGRDVVDIGMVPTPVLYFATHFLGSNTGVMVTGSHNPPDYNGLKIVIAGTALSGEAIAALGHRIEDGNLFQGSGSRIEQDLLPDYMERVTGDVQLSRPLKVVVDCGNGVAGVVGPAMLQAIGCEVIELYCDVDGNFPNHHPDPGDPRNLSDLIAAVRGHGADVGVAFDGDGDRLGVVDSSGKVIWPDRLLMLLARDVLSRHPGADILFDVKSSRHLVSEILSYGGRPIMWKTGHSLIKAKMKETGALLAGEMSGHIFFKERWYGFDDGVYSCARTLEALSREPGSSAEVFAGLPESASTPELGLKFPAEGENFALMERVIQEADFGDGKLVTIDGARVEFQDGWGLMRPSNTGPSMVFRFEADSEEGLQRIQALFRQQLLAIDPALKLPF